MVVWWCGVVHARCGGVLMEHEWYISGIGTVTVMLVERRGRLPTRLNLDCRQY